MRHVKISWSENESRILDAEEWKAILDSLERDIKASAASGAYSSTRSYAYSVVKAVYRHLQEC